MPTLIARSGPLAGRRFELDDEVVLGRENATITLADEETSRRHAAIRVTGGTVVIEDLGSTNGTFVDGKRIDAATQLSGGETIKMGQTIFYVEVEVAAPEPADAGATRMAARPEPVADPDRTAVRQRPPEAAPPPPEPVADPDRTAQRPRPEPAPAASADADRTALRPRPAAPEAAPPPPAEPVAEPERTALRPRPGREPAPAASAPAPKPAAPAAPARPARGVAPPSEQPFGAFAPPAGRKRGGIATRKIAPAALSFATIITTAAALVIYFIGR